MTVANSPLAVFTESFIAENGHILEYIDSSNVAVIPDDQFEDLVIELFEDHQVEDEFESDQELEEGFDAIYDIDELEDLDDIFEDEDFGSLPQYKSPQELASYVMANIDPAEASEFLRLILQPEG